MEPVEDPDEAGWGMRLNRWAWSSAKDWPAWTNPHQREKWREKGLIVWDKASHTVARLKARHVLAIVAELRNNAQLQQQGCIVGEPAWRLSLGKPNGKGEPVLANQILLDPEQTALLLVLLMQEEGVLKQIADEEEAEESRVLAEVYGLLIEIAERGKHTIYDEDLSWEENKRVMRRRWESGEFPKELTWTEERLYADLMEEINAEHQREEQKRQERGRRIKKNLLSHHFFWERVKSLWPYLTAAERLHILQQLQDIDWNERIVSEIRQIIEHAQFFDAAAQKAGAAQGRDKLTGEELDLLLDLPDEELWNELLNLYRQKPHADPED